MSKETDLVSIKSHNSQFVLKIKSGNYEDAIKHLKEKFSNNTLLQGIKVINKIDAPDLDVVDIQRIKDFLKCDLNIDFLEKPKSTKSKSTNKSQATMQEIGSITQNKLTDTDKISEEILENTDYRTKIIKNNLRSGALINYDGNILVIGDVNAGAELVATGNIIVFGTLRGFAIAGAKGDKNVMVVANKISATQLRIAELIAIPPKDDNSKSLGVQIASVNNNKIEIEQY